MKRLVNQLMTSNCFIVYDEISKRCVVIDPGSEKSEREIMFIREKQLRLDYIMLTHEHTDHTWGVNSLVEAFRAPVVCSKSCKDNLIKESRAYFQYYYNDSNYHYEVKRVDLTIEEIDYNLSWNGTIIHFVPTPGHSMGSVCIELENYLFTGDTLMEYKPYISKRNGSKEEYRRSIDILVCEYAGREMIICPGHGELTRVDKCLKIMQ